MLKATVSSVLALSLLAAAGCGKEQPPPAPAAPAAPAESTQLHPMPTGAPAADVDLASIAKADGGKTVAEVYAEKDGLADATVVVRGKVVKVNAGIMDRNWLHVRDGSEKVGQEDVAGRALEEVCAVHRV